MPYQNKSEQVIKKKNEIDTLKRHLLMQRMKISGTTRELIQYCNTHLPDDPLVYPIKENPFKDKGRCQII